MIYLREKIDFIERFIIGIALAAGMIGIISYYVGLMGLNVKYHAIVLPLFLILIGLIFNLRR